jgi:hypothetical protein
MIERKGRGREREREGEREREREEGVCTRGREGKGGEVVKNKKKIKEAKKGIKRARVVFFFCGGENENPRGERQTGRETDSQNKKKGAPLREVTGTAHFSFVLSYSGTHTDTHTTSPICLHYSPSSTT